MLHLQMAFGVFRAYAIEAGVKQPKYFFFSWSGPTAPLKRKVAANAIKTSVLDFFSPVHASSQVSSHAELSEEEVVKKLNGARGSHKPSGYEFGTGKEEEEEDDEIEARKAEEARIAKEAADAEAARLEAERIAKEEADRVAAELAAKEEAERLVREEEERKAKEGESHTCKHANSTLH